MKYITALLAVLALALFTTPARAQDPVKVDPKHYKVEFENDQVRVLRIHYGVGEKSVMHAHPANCAIFLNDQTFNFTIPDGTTEPASVRAGQLGCGDGNVHLPENTRPDAAEIIMVEFKNRQRFKQ